ncbi:hypothetical protein LINGRAHAP2_LOCUS9168 [Linum grandiflorum]
MITLPRRRRRSRLRIGELLMPSRLIGVRIEIKLISIKPNPLEPAGH